MRRLLLILLLSLATLLSSASKDGTYSFYENRQFTTVSIITIDAPRKLCMSMVDDMVEQFRYNPEQLFTWVFKGLGKQDGEDNDKNDVLIIFKENYYDKKSEVGTLMVDIDISGLKTYEDVRIDSKVTYSKPDSLTDAVAMDIYYSNTLLDKAYGTLFVKELSEDQTQLTIEMNVKFGWFFNIFITKRRYAQLIEWRADGVMKNLKIEAEKRKGSTNYKFSE